MIFRRRYFSVCMEALREQAGSMELYRYRNQKKMRRGLSTGTCAAAAAKAAMEKLVRDRFETKVFVRLPGGEQAFLDVSKASDGSFFTIKDGGDDPDATSGLEIHVRAARMDFPPLEDDLNRLHMFHDPEDPRLYLTGGPGVGMVTRKGLEQDIGMYAINQVPRRMIFSSAKEVLDAAEIGYADRFLLTVSVPGGETAALKTFNPKLGIINGISILGTSGVVEPMSEQSIVDTIEVEIRQQLANGSRSMIFVPGNMGARYVEHDVLPRLGGLRLPIIQISNYVGDALDLAVSYELENVLLVGNIGKFIKLAAGIMNTHSHTADARWEIMVSHAALQGVETPRLKELRQCITTEEMLTKLLEWGSLEPVVRSLLSEIDRHLSARLGDRVPFGLKMYSERYGLLGETPGTGKILKALKHAGGTE